jgi:hypothetical protein
VTEIEMNTSDEIQVTEEHRGINNGSVAAAVDEVLKSLVDMLHRD